MPPQAKWYDPRTQFAEESTEELTTDKNTSAKKSKKTKGKKIPEDEDELIEENSDL